MAFSARLQKSPALNIWPISATSSRWWGTCSQCSFSTFAEPMSSFRNTCTCKNWYPWFVEMVARNDARSDVLFVVECMWTWAESTEITSISKSFASSKERSVLPTAVVPAIIRTVYKDTLNQAINQFVRMLRLVVHLPLGFSLLLIFKAVRVPVIHCSAIRRYLTNLIRIATDLMRYSGRG